MGKTISLKLTPDEELIIDLICKRGVSHSTLLRDALRHYFNLVDQKVYHLTGEEVNQKVDSVNRFTGEEVNQTGQAVYHSTGEAVNQEVNPVDQKVNRFTGEKVNPAEDKFLSLYIEQLNSRIQELDNEIQEWRNKDATESQYLKDSYNSLQTEYYNQTKDSVKRLDDKFDRIMFYLEESRRPTLPPDTSPHPRKESDVNVDNILKISKKKRAEKPKKGWIFQMYRM